MGSCRLSAASEILRPLGFIRDALSHGVMLAGADIRAWYRAEGGRVTGCRGDGSSATSQAAGAGKQGDAAELRTPSMVLGKGNARAQSLLESVFNSQSVIRVGFITQFDPNRAAFDSALGAAELQRGVRVD